MLNHIVMFRRKAEVAVDPVLESGFDNTDALNAYLFHPLHQALIAALRPYFEWAAVDYTV